MPFEIISSKSYAARDAAPVRAALYTKANRGPVIELVFDKDTLKRVKWEAGVSRIIVAEGSGPDQGIVQFQLSTFPGKGVALTKRSTVNNDAALRINCANFLHHKFNPEHIALHPAVHQIFGSTITVIIETLLVKEA